MSTEPRDRDWDAEFAQITRHLDLDAASESATRRGAHRDLFEPTSDETTPMTLASPAPADDGPVPGFRPQWRMPDEQPWVMTPPPHGQAGSAAGQYDHDDLDDLDEEPFVPPEPAPFETGDPASVIMLACFVLGPVWLLYLTLFDREAATLWWLVAAGLLVGGFALAVARQPKNRDEHDDDDDGARV